MNASNALQSFQIPGQLDVQLLSEEDLLSIGGGTGPIMIALYAALGGVGLLAAGIVVGVAVYAFTH